MAMGDADTIHEGEKWKVKVEGSSRASSTHDTKAEAVAVAAGRDRAKTDKVEHVIKKLDGTIGEKNSYDPKKDKFPPRG